MSSFTFDEMQTIKDALAVTEAVYLAESRGRSEEEGALFFARDKALKAREVRDKLIAIEGDGLGQKAEGEKA